MSQAGGAPRVIEAEGTRASVLDSPSHPAKLRSQTHFRLAGVELRPARGRTPSRHDMTEFEATQPSGDQPAGYDPAAVERRWQARWETEATNVADLSSGARPFYALMMFPYPSAEGLHVGNLFAFTGNDIYGRFQRLKGHTVFEPMGYDAFGIHSENFALKVGVHPSELIPRNIDNFRRQLKRAGLMVDWTHELSTTDPRYYKWTQWVFLQLHRQGLAYKKKGAVNEGMSGETTATPLEIRVFTTRPDTLFGATYLVLAPEHPLVPQIVADEQR